MIAPHSKNSPVIPNFTELSKNEDLIHFVGIGGIGMSGIAEVMHNMGYKVQGSDNNESANTERLRDLQIPIFIGQDSDNIEGVSVVVVSTAIKPDNPEIRQARKKHIPVVRRADMLAELMRLKSTIAIAGTHGKTTTTSLVGTILDHASFDPTVINGGIINAYGTNARMGAGDWMVVEADESDGSFLRLPPTIGVITNIDPEHLDHYGSFDAIRSAFVEFISHIPFYGYAVLCTDHPEVQALLSQATDRHIITYGFNLQSDIRAENLRTIRGGFIFDVTIHDRKNEQTHSIKDLHLSMPGRHNVLNSLAAVAIAWLLHIDEDVIRSSFRHFTGIKRRFTHVGTMNGADVIDDYGHHPTEIRATLEAAQEEMAARKTSGRVIAIAQPHRYSRLQSLLMDFATCFNDADLVFITPVYPAGEAPIEGIDHHLLKEKIRLSGHRAATATDSFEDLSKELQNLVTPDDMIIFLGAGNITKWASKLAQGQ